jgi:hypothetical protein
MNPLNFWLVDRVKSMQNDGLAKLINDEVIQAVPDSVHVLVNQIKKQGNVVCVLFYGSGLWKKADDDTVYDFYVLIDSYRDWGSSWSMTLAGSILAPNVYYTECVDGTGKIVRCKYAVMRVDQFVKASQGKTITPQIWARFAQPSCIVYVLNDMVRNKVVKALSNCVMTFHRYALPLTRQDAKSRDIWLQGLAGTYGAELRSERPDRTAVLFESSADSLTKRTKAVLPFLTEIKRDSQWAVLVNVVKRPIQKTVTLFRLMKAVFTFEGGVDYILWKIERQSGVAMKATDFQRKYPLIGAWPLVWKLWRKGAFR